MIKPTFEEFEGLTEQGNLIPIYQELPADMETPVSVFLKLRGNGPAILLESVERGEQVGRYSFLAAAPQRRLTGYRDRVVIRDNGSAKTQPLADDEDPLTVVEALLNEYQLVETPGLPRFVGGAVGYMSYDLVRFFERLPATAEQGLGLPLCDFLFTDTLVVFDHVKHKLLIIALTHTEGDPRAAYDDAIDRIDHITQRLRQPLTHHAPRSPQHAARSRDLESNMSPEVFGAAVRQAKDYIAAGDIFQVVLSQRFARQTEIDSFSIYRALRMLNPSPYMVYVELGGLDIIASSPEMLVRLDHGIAEVRPIAGTRRRGATPEEDTALAEELLADPKERAEHVMLVDLGRNDLGRVCGYGTVEVPELMTIERYSHVMHIVSSVRGRLNGNHSAFDLLRVTFPAGTVSGAPKVRAMEIIEELEGLRRGPYAGAIGYFGYGGSMDTCITIRTILKQDDTAYIQAGAGIVADSDPAREYQETVNKAAALAEAITIAERGLE
ncbi:MAG: Anthranilate synthase component 1 [Anaerolineales bacterium]|nr:Anthranilate synthase component 1 [Anaerolineales bacterium]